MSLPESRMDGDLLQQALFRIESLREGLNDLRTCVSPQDPSLLKILQNILTVDNMRAEQMNKSAMSLIKQHIAKSTETQLFEVGVPQAINYVMVQVGSDVVVFEDNKQSQEPDTAVVLVGRSLSDIQNSHGFEPASDDPDSIPHFRV